MRTLLLISAATLGLAFVAPAAQAMPIAGQGLDNQSTVTQVRMKKRHHTRHHWRARSRNNLSTGLPGTGPARDMSKTNGGRANDR